MPDAYTQIPRSQNSEDRLMAGVASAAVVSGELIIGLDDGRIIRAGYVQGPTGLTGPEGAVGATGQRGMDGNTILSGAEKPKPESGKEGDFWINTRDWYIYGPKTSGQWGTGTYMLGPKEYLRSNRGNQGGGGTAPSSEGGGGSLGSVFSNQVYLTGTGRTVDALGGNIIHEGKGLSVQSNLNKWFEGAIRDIDTAIPVAIVDSPRDGAYKGELGYYEGDLYLWLGDKWDKVGTSGGVHVGPTPPAPAEEGQLWFNSNNDELTLYVYTRTEWIPAAPPVSLEGVNTAIAGIDEQLLTINRNVAINKSEADEKLFDIDADQKVQNDAIGTNSRDITQLRSRVGDLEMGVGAGDFLPTAGGELKGTLQINGTQNAKIDPLLCRADGYYMSFGVSKNGDVFAGASTSNPFLATEGWHVVTKGYLDQALPVPGPAKYAWKHRTVSGKEPADGYMNFDKINWTQRHETMYFSPTPAVGPKFKLPKSKLIVEHHGSSTSTDSPLCSVWKAPKSDGTWELQGSFRIERIETDSNGILAVTVGQDGWGSCGAEHEIVYFTIGGLF